MPFPTTETEDKPSCVMESLTIQMILACDKQLADTNNNTMPIKPNFRFIRMQVKPSFSAHEWLSQFWAEAISLKNSFV
jgi:hypothetical protein